MDSPEVADPTPFSLTMSAVPDAAVWGRSYVAALARALGVESTDADDLRLAASEIVTAILASRPDEIRIRATAAPDRVGIRFEPGLTPAAGTDGAEIDPWDVVSALFEDAAASPEAVTLSVVRRRR